MSDDTAATMPAPAPIINPETKPFWDATCEGKLLLKRCNACGDAYWYPRMVCPLCSSSDTTWIQSSGKGVIYSFSIARKGAGEFSAAGPYVLAYVQLEEGPTVLTNIVDCDRDALGIGDAVAVVFHQTDADAALYRFRPI